jgi:flagellar protein FliS
MLQSRHARAAQQYQSLDLGSRIACANPHELVALLFEGLRSTLGMAERSLGQGRAALRVRSVTRALAILDALDASLDHLRGGSVASALSAVYAQVRALVVAGNAESRPELFAAAASQISALDEAWADIAPQRRPKVN